MKTLLTFALLAVSGSMYAQQLGTPPVAHHPRAEDHMMRHRVRTRLDLKDKLNQPLSQVEYQTDPGVYTESRFAHVQGMPQALLQGWLQSKPGEVAYVGYNPNQLTQPVVQQEVRRLLWERSPEYQAQMWAARARDENPNAPLQDEGPKDVSQDTDPFAYDYDYNWDVPAEDLVEDALNTPGPAEVVTPDFVPGMLVGTDVVMELVEDRVFDKNKGTEHFIPRYVVLRSINPGMVGQEDMGIVAFRWEDVRPLLAHTQWKNPHNDAEMRTALQIIETRQFAHLILNIRGENMESLALAHRRVDQLTAYEHNLWNY
jgi:hypothetical protein